MNLGFQGSWSRGNEGLSSRSRVSSAKVIGQLNPGASRRMSGVGGHTSKGPTGSRRRPGRTFISRLRLGEVFDVPDPLSAEVFSSSIHIHSIVQGLAGQLLVPADVPLQLSISNSMSSCAFPATSTSLF